MVIGDPLLPGINNTEEMKLSSTETLEEATSRLKNALSSKIARFGEVWGFRIKIKYRVISCLRANTFNARKTQPNLNIRVRKSDNCGCKWYIRFKPMATNPLNIVITVVSNFHTNWCSHLQIGWLLQKLKLVILLKFPKSYWMKYLSISQVVSIQMKGISDKLFQNVYQTGN